MNTINNPFSTALSYHRSGNFVEASKLYRFILSLEPDNLAVLNNLGLISDPNEKIDFFKRAIGLDPEFADARFNLAVAFEQQGRPADALEHYGKIIQIVNDLFSQGNFESAVAKLERLIQLRPDFKSAKLSIASAYINIGATQQKKGLFKEAIDSFSKALQHNPKNHVAHGNIIFTQNFIFGMDTAQQQQERSRYNDAYARQYVDAKYWRTYGVDPRLVKDKLHKLRIGYVSGNFNAYAATFAFAPLILDFDHDQFEVVCYADQTTGDTITELFKSKVSLWREISGKDDDEVAQLITADKIDILVDCAGFQKGNRLLAFARKPAPIQVTAWGEPTGTGLSAMDYLMADPVLIPAEERHLFAETIIDLPCFLGYWVPEPLPEPSPLPAIASGRVTFGSFNRGAKHNDALMTLWVKVLNAVPGSVLLMKAPEWDQPEQRASLLDRFARCGGTLDQISFLGYMSHNDHLASYGCIDICLDPQPHSGGMTTLDALYMGIPVLTMPGATPSSRLASAILSAIGLDDWIATDSEAFVAKAAAFTADLSTLGKLRNQLRFKITESSIGNNTRYARAVEAQYRRMWQNWCGDPNNDVCARQ